MDVLILDDWGLHPIHPIQQRDLMELLDDRYTVRSTIMTSQYPINKWYEIMEDPTLADAILDRIVDNVHKIKLRGSRCARSKDNENWRTKPHNNEDQSDTGSASQFNRIGVPVQADSLFQLTRIPTQVDQKIAIDRFRVTKYIGRLMDEVRRQENRELRKQGMENLIRTKHDWPTNEKNMSVRQKK